MSVKEKINRAPRKHLIYFIIARSSSGESFTGRLVNISSSGLKMITKEKLFLGAAYHLDIALPEEINESKHITFTGKTVWCKHNTSPDHFSAGFKITEIDETNENLINELIKDFKH